MRARTAHTRRSLIDTRCVGTLHSPGSSPLPLPLPRMRAHVHARSVARAHCVRCRHQPRYAERRYSTRPSAPSRAHSVSRVRLCLAERPRSDSGKPSIARNMRHATVTNSIGWVADREPSLQLHLVRSPKWCSTAAKEGGLAPVAHLVRLAPSRSSSSGQRAHICTGTALTRATSALHQDWACRCHICTSAESLLPTSGLRSSRLRRIQSGRRCPKSCARCCSSRSHTMCAVRRPQPSPARSLSSFATVSPGGCTCACAAQTCAHCPLLAFRVQAGFVPLLRRGG